MLRYTKWEDWSLTTVSSVFKSEKKPIILYIIRQELTNLYFGLSNERMCTFIPTMHMSFTQAPSCRGQKMVVKSRPGIILRPWLLLPLALVPLQKFAIDFKIFQLCPCAYRAHLPFAKSKWPSPFKDEIPDRQNLVSGSRQCIRSIRIFWRNQGSHWQRIYVWRK